MWDVGYSNDSSLSLLSIRSLSIGVVFSFVCGLYVFWLRSYDKTGVGCDNCTWPPSQTENFINPSQTPILRMEYCSTVKHYETVE